MKTAENVIVTLTSWSKRIQNVAPVVNTLLKQTITPSKILINLCIQDFPNMEEDLPNDLLELVRDNPTTEIYWYIENYKPYKKHLHALEIAGPDDLIVTTDDDHLYPEDFLEKLYVSYCYYGKKHPITVNKGMLCHNLWTFNGPGTLYRKSDWGPCYQKYLLHSVLHDTADDIFITLLFASNGILVMPEIFAYPNDDDLLFNDVYCYTDPKAKLKTDEGTEEYRNIFFNTLNALTETFGKNYFKGQPTRYSPCYWDIIVDLLSKAEAESEHPLPALQHLFDEAKEHPLEANEYYIDTNSLSLEVPRTLTKADYLGENSKLVVTIASWPGRIHNVATVLKDIVYNTISPDEIVINLARPDFNIPEGYNATIDDLLVHDSELQSLADLMVENPNIYIAWHNDATIKSWKKHLYVLDHYDPNDVVICIDDDIRYSAVFIETMLKSYHLFDREHPITNCTTNFCQGTYSFHGIAMLYKISHFGDYKKYLNDAITHMFPEDNHLLNILFMNGVCPMPVIGRNFLFDDLYYNEGESNFGNNVFTSEWFASYNEIMAESERIVESNPVPEIIARNWYPAYYNYSNKIVEDYLIKHENDEYSDDQRGQIKKKVYDTLYTHYHSNFGENEDTTKLYLSIDNVIL